MSTPSLTDNDVQLAAQRIIGFSQSLKEAHDFGHGPGAIDEVWGRRFHEKAIQIYTTTIPWPYLIDLATRFNATARHMTARGSKPTTAEDWLIITDYLRNSAETILAYAPEHLCEPNDPGPIHSSTPSVMPYSLLAEIAGTAGIARLADAATAVATSLTGTPPQPPDTAGNPLSSGQISLLRKIANGQRSIDISRELGYSERSLYRHLQTIWTTLGVTTRSEGIARAAAEGWLDARNLAPEFSKQ